MLKYCFGQFPRSFEALELCRPDAGECEQIGFGQDRPALATASGDRAGISNCFRIRCVYLQRTNELRNRFLVGPPGLEPGTKAL
jgi:hypothetical protein